MKDDLPFLTLVVSYRLVTLSPVIPASSGQNKSNNKKTDKKIDKSWHKTMTEADWTLFESARIWRSECAIQTGIPPFFGNR